MWRHVVAVAAAIAVTLVILQFWGNFGGAMTRFVELKAAHDQAQTPMPVSVMPASSPACGKGAPCPSLPDTAPAPQPHGKP